MNLIQTSIKNMFRVNRGHWLFWFLLFSSFLLRYLAWKFNSDCSWSLMCVSESLSLCLVLLRCLLFCVSFFVPLETLEINQFCWHLWRALFLGFYPSSAQIPSCLSSSVPIVNIPFIQNYHHSESNLNFWWQADALLLSYLLHSMKFRFRFRCRPKI